MTPSLNGAVRHRDPETEELRKLESRRAAVRKSDDQVMPADERREADEQLTRQIEELRRQVEAGGRETASGPDRPGLVVVKASEAREMPVEWVWHSRFPAGAISLLTGKPDDGKTSVALDLMARISDGRPLPGESIATGPRRVAILSTEDRFSILRGRLGVAGARLDRVGLIESNLQDGSPFDVRSGAEALGRRIRDEQLRMVVLDPISALLPSKLDSHRDAAVREVFRPMVSEVGETDCALVAIRHPRKGAASDARDAGLGSVAVGALARSELLVARHEGRRVLACAKQNYGPKPPAIFFEIIERDRNPLVVWQEETDLSADDLTGERGETTNRAEVRQALEEHLRDKPQPARDTATYLCREFGVSESTVQRAARELGVLRIPPEVRGTKAPYMWALPESGGPGQPGKVVVSHSGGDR
jgi:hypothetical protein